MKIHATVRCEAKMMFNCIELTLRITKTQIETYMPCVHIKAVVMLPFVIWDRSGALFKMHFRFLGNSIFYPLFITTHRLYLG